MNFPSPEERQRRWTELRSIFREWIWGTSLDPTPLLLARHWIHRTWNQSPYNPNFDKWIGDCSCCCGTCERVRNGE